MTATGRSEVGIVSGEEGSYGEGGSDGGEGGLRGDNVNDDDGGWEGGVDDEGESDGGVDGVADCEGDVDAVIDWSCGPLIGVSGRPPAQTQTLRGSMLKLK